MPKHSDFEKIYKKYIKQYGLEKGKQVYYAWVNKHGYDDTKPFPGKKEFFSYHFTNGIKFKEDNGEFYSEGYIATSHPDKYKDKIPKNTLQKITEKIKNNEIGRNLFYPSFVSVRHDWIDLDNGEFKDLPIAGKATSAELRQLPDGEWGVWVSTHHSKLHPDFENVKYNVEHGYYPGYSIEYNTIAEHKEGDYNILDDIELIGYAFADGRFIANPHAQIENYGYKEMRKLNLEETNMETEVQKKEVEVDYKEQLDKLQEDLKVKEAKIAELSKVKEIDPKEAKIKEMETRLKEFEELKLKEAEAIKLKEEEAKHETKIKEIIANITAKQMPGFTKFESGAMGLPEIKEYFDSVKAGTISIKEANKVANRYPELIERTTNRKAISGGESQIFNAKLKSVVEGVEPYIGKYDYSMSKVSVKALTAFETPSNDETTYYQAPAELGDVYDPALVSQLNDDTIFLGIVPKEDHSNRQNIQFRAKTAYGTAGGYLEGDSTWTATNTTRVKLEQRFAYWRETFEVTNQAIQAAAAAGGIGDVMGAEIQDANINMLKDINSTLLTGAAGTYDGETAGGFYLLGLQHICLNTGNLYGKDRSSLTWLQAQTPDTTSEGISLNVMRKMIENVRTTPADARKENLVFVTSLRQERLLYSLLQGMQGGWVPTSARVGFTGMVDVDGIPVYADGQADTDDLFLLDFSHLRFAIQKAPSVTMMGITGATKKGFVDMWMNLYTTKPKNNAWHSALST